MATGDVSNPGAARRHKTAGARQRLIAGATAALAASALAVLPASAAHAARLDPSRAAPARYQNKQLTIGVILASPSSALVDMGDGARTESQRLGMGFVYESGSSSWSTQLSPIETLISKHVNAIITLSLATKSRETSIGQARAAGIPVLGYDGTDPGLTVNMTNPDYQASYDMVGFVARHLRSENRPCDLALLDGVSTVPAFAIRDAGMAAGAAANGCTVLAARVATDGTLSSAATIIAQWKGKFGSKLQAIIPYSDGAALDAVTAVRGGFDPVVVGFSGEPQTVKDVISGKLWMDYALQSTIMGEALAWAAHQVLTGHTVPATVYSPYVLLTEANSRSYRGDAYYLSHPPRSFHIVQYDNQYQLTYSGS